MKRKFFLLASALAALGVLAIGVTYSLSLIDKYEGFKDSMSGMSGVKFGDSQDEILYSLGSPKFVQEAEFDGEGDSDRSRLRTPEFDFPPGAKVEDYPIWIWLSDGKTLTVEFDMERKEVISIGCSTNDENVRFSVCRTVGGVMTGKDFVSLSGRYYGSEKYIIESLGKPDREAYSKVGDLSRKIIVYDALGLQLVLVGRQLLSIHKYESHPDFIWWLQYGPSS